MNAKQEKIHQPRRENGRKSLILGLERTLQRPPSYLENFEPIRMRVTMGHTISQSTVILEHYLPGSSPTHHFDRREDPGDEVGISDPVVSSENLTIAAESYHEGA